MEHISVLCHIFYDNSLETIKAYLANLKKYKVSYLFNVCSETIYCQQLVKQLQENFDSPVITVSPNVGKDIGGKLVLLDTYHKLKLHSDYLILLHDKVSPHTSTGSKWREKLFAVLEPENIEKAIYEFSKNKKTGLIASSRLIMNEYDKRSKTYHCTSNHILHALRNHYKISTEKQNFIAGTMFWIRAEIYEDFFSKYSALQIRSTLERGNVQDQQNGSFAHAWERMFSWIAFQQGFNLKGI